MKTRETATLIWFLSQWRLASELLQRHVPSPPHSICSSGFLQVSCLFSRPALSLGLFLCQYRRPGSSLLSLSLSPSDLTSTCVSQMIEKKILLDIITVIDKTSIILNLIHTDKYNTLLKARGQQVHPWGSTPGTPR